MSRTAVGMGRGDSRVSSNRLSAESLSRTLVPVRFAIVVKDEEPGLQIKVNGEWRDVPPRPGAFVCNLGDLLQRW